MKTLALLILAVALSGCTLLETMQNNEAVINIAVRQAVFRYIDAGTTEADKNARAAAVVEVVRKVDAFLEGNPEAAPATLLTVVDNQIPWQKLSALDELLLRDVMLIIRHNLQNRQNEGLLDGDAIVGLRALLETAALTASLL